MGMLFDLIDPEELVGFARAAADELTNNVFHANEFLPFDTVEDIEWALKRRGIQDVDIAKFRAWDTPAPMTGRPGVSRVRGQIAPISRQIALSEEEGLRLRALELGNNDATIRAIFDDVERMIRSVLGRVEVAVFDTLIDGICSLEENDLHLEADYSMPATHQVTLTGADTWTVANRATALPITQLLAAAETYNDDNGFMPGRLVMSRKRLPGLQVNDEVLSYAASGGTTPQRVDLPAINGILADQDLPAIEFYDTLVRDLGVQKRVLPSEFVLMLPATDTGAEQFGATLFGPTAEGVLLAEKGFISRKQVSGVVATVNQNEHPVQTFTVGNAVALPVVPNADYLFTLKVDADTPDIIIPQF